MRRMLISAAAALGLLLSGGAPSPQASEAPVPFITDVSGDETTLDALDCVDDTAMAIAQAADRLPQEGGVASDEWPPHAIGGVIPPVRSVPIARSSPANAW